MNNETMNQVEPNNNEIVLTELETIAASLPVQSNVRAGAAAVCRPCHGYCY